MVTVDTLRFTLDYLKSDTEKKLLKTDTVEILYQKKNVVKGRKSIPEIWQYVNLHLTYTTR